MKEVRLRLERKEGGNYIVAGCVNYLNGFSTQAKEQLLKEAALRGVSQNIYLHSNNSQDYYTKRKNKKEIQCVTQYNKFSCSPFQVGSDGAVHS